MRPTTCALLLVLLLTTACGGDAVKDPGPAPAPDHQETVRAVMDRVLDERYRLEGSPRYRFAEPVQDRVALWHFEPNVDGQSHSFGYRHGWRVDFWVTPRYVGYPEQPESRRMAFFGEGALRGIFSTGGGNAPLELDKWSADWIDPAWQVPARAAAPR